MSCAFIGVGDAAATIVATYGLDGLPDPAAWFGAAVGAEAATIIEDLSEGVFSQHALVVGPPYLRSVLYLPVRTTWGKHLGFLGVAGSARPAAAAHGCLPVLQDIAGLLGEALEWERRHARLLEVTDRAVRADRMLRQVSEAASCTDALTSMLSELCRHHGAMVGRIWRLMDDETMQEVSRFAEDSAELHAYYRALPTEPVRAGNSKTAEAIRQHQPRAFFYSHEPNPDRYVLMEAAIAAGLASQVSYPIWVQEQRFGVSLAFTTERPDLDAIVADVASAATSIRPALFRKVTEERIRYMAHHDELTQLGNRTVLNERLAAAMDAGPASGATCRTGQATGLALLYLDLDGFKLVNDSRGHGVGDKLLAAIAGRLRASVCENDTIARIGGDEFAIIHPGAGQPDGAAKLARRVLAAIAQPVEIDGQPSTVGVSIGIALYPADGETPDVLQRNADAALYAAKQSGRNTFRLFEKSAAIVQRQRSELERDLRPAIERGQLALVYQPIVVAQTREVWGMEALLRWHHPSRGELLPAKFVPLAEGSGLSAPLGRWVLQAACKEASTWTEPAMLSVNVSPLQLQNPGLAGDVEAALRASGLPADRLHFEITNGLAHDDKVLRMMHLLRERGIRLYWTTSASRYPDSAPCGGSRSICFTSAETSCGT